MTREPLASEVTAIDVHTPDGVQLRTIQVVTELPEPRGTVLVRTPYDARRIVPEAWSWASAGYDVYVQDVRGRYGSDGDWCPYAHEGPDGAATVRTLAREERIRGPLLLSGSSYGAHAAIEAARTLHDDGGPLPIGIVAMVPALGLWDTAHDPDGTPRIRDRIGWWLQHGVGRTSRSPASSAVIDAIEDRAGRLGPRQAACGTDIPLAHWHRLWDAARPDPRTRWGAIGAPLLVVTGDDDFFVDDAYLLIEHWPGPSTLISGPWGHGLATELPADHSVRLSLRAHGGLLAQVLAWASTLSTPATPPPRTTPRVHHRFDSITGWTTDPPERAL